MSRKRLNESAGSPSRHAPRGAAASRRGWVRRESVWAVAMAGGMLGVVGVTGALATLPTTVLNFFLPGTQPGMLLEQIADANDCYACHGEYDAQREPFRPWAASMMGQSARDPVFYAALAIANQDAAYAGELCLRCHTPGAWLEGRSADPTGGSLMNHDFQGVSCNMCHRMVNPEYTKGQSPQVDQSILAQVVSAVGQLPPDPHSAAYIVDPLDRRRGPYNLGPNFFYHDWAQSPFHQSSAMCATCHDVSNPVYQRQPDGTYAFLGPNTPHPTGSKFDMFPVERTFSEWQKSAFGAGPVDVGGRFGGDLPAVSSCQDCHMPVSAGKGCRLNSAPVRPDLSQHHFNGGNTWVLKAIRELYPDWETFLSEESVNDSIARAVAMLQNASDMQLSLSPGGPTGRQVKVRVINWSGHKLPTGYPEGRRMWVNVKFRDAQGQLVAERGAYDAATATLTAADTKVYEAKIGVDAAVSAATGVPVGPSFHFALNNTWYLDNRIPPVGFTNAAFASVQAAPVGYAYADGQHWDDTLYDVPAGAAAAEATLYFQLTSKEYMEFLRDKNTTNSAGQVAYDLWVQFGKSEPVAMDVGTIAIPAACYANCDGSTSAPVLNAIDFSCFLQRYQQAQSLPAAQQASAYANCDGSTSAPALNALDFGCFLTRYRAGCP